jgi:hypothetical protein
MFHLFANYIAIGLGLQGTLVPLYGKTNGFLNLSQAFALPKSPIQDSWVCYERLTAAHMLAWVLLNFTEGSFPFLIFRPDNFTYVCHGSSYQGPMEERAYYVLLLAWVHLSDKNLDV